MAFNLPGVPFKLTAEDMGNPDIARSFKSGQEIISNLIAQELNNLEAQKRKAVLPYEGKMAMENLIAQQLANKFQAPRSEMAPQFAEAELAYNQGKPSHQQAETNYINQQSKYYAPNVMSQIAERQAQTEAQLLKNPFIAQSEKSRIEEETARAKYYGMVGPTSKGGVALQEENAFQQSISKDNPQLMGDPNKIYEAANILAQGGNKLSDGTSLNSLSPTSRRILDRLLKGSTTSGVLNALIQSAQADEEIGVLSKYAQKGLEPYGNTILGMSPEQVVDSFKTDDNSQIKLGRLIGAKQLQYEIAQNQIRLAMGHPGVTSTQHLMKLAQQDIKTYYPKLSYKARHEANRYFTEALKEGLNARKKVGVSPSSVLNVKQESKSNKSLKYNPNTGELE